MAKSEKVPFKVRGRRALIQLAVFYFLAVMLGVLIALFNKLYLFRTHDFEGPLRWLVAALPGLVIAASLYMCWRAIRKLDELFVDAFRQALFATLGLGSATILIWTFIADHTSAPGLAAPYIFPLYAAWWGVCCPFVFRKLR